MLSTLTDMALLEEVKAGNMAAFRTLYYRHVDHIYGLVTRILGPSRGDREDVVQEVFFQAHRSVGQFQGRSSVATWLYRIAANVSYSHLRGVASKVVTTREVPSPASQMETGEKRVDARRAIQKMYTLLDQLSAKNRMVFTLYEFEGLTLEQIAELLEIPLHTVASRLRRARERLMREITKGGMIDTGREQ